MHVQHYSYFFLSEEDLICIHNSMAKSTFRALYCCRSNKSGFAFVCSECFGYRLAIGWVLDFIRVSVPFFLVKDALSNYFTCCSVLEWFCGSIEADIPLNELEPHEKVLSPESMLVQYMV